MPHRRIARALSDLLDRWYPWVFATVGLLLVVVAIVNVGLVVSNGNLRNKVDADTARLDATDHARTLAKVTGCYSGAYLGARANAILDVIRADHRERARDARKLVKADPTTALRKAHQDVADRQDTIAASIEPFPVPTLKQCDRQGKALVGRKTAKRIRVAVERSVRGSAPGK